MTSQVILLLIHQLPERILRCVAVTQNQLKGKSKMANANDRAYFNEYLGYIEIGATETEALIEVANVNEVGVCEVYDALLRSGLRNPCGNSEAYCM
jgi:hypothetical protein